MQIQKERLFSLFSQLVSFDSPSYGERQICDFLQKKLKSLGLNSVEDDCGRKIGGQCGNLYTKVNGNLDLPPLLFCAHMDTVQPAFGKRAIFHPDGQITSDGSTVLGADDCSGIAVILEALSIIKEKKLPHRPLEILLTAAEEPYCKGIAQMDFSKLESKQAYVWDMSGPVGSAAYEAPTIISFRAAFLGRSAHAGFAPEKGIHTIQAAGMAVSQIQCGRADDVTINIGTISGGIADNIVPDRCELTGEIRSFSDQKANEKLTQIVRILKDSANRYGAQVEIQTEKHCVAYCTDLNHLIISRFKKACQKHGLPAQLCQTYGGSDNNHLALHGISGLVVATAMNACHTCQEYTTNEELIRAAELALELMLSTD